MKQQWAARLNKHTVSSARGFTLVELIIVIVVIGILATIGLVTYRGIQERARNTARIAAATQIYKSLVNYVTTSGANPPAPVCLPVGTKDYNGDGVPDCGTITSTVQSSEKAAFNTILSSERINMTYPVDEIVNGGTKFTGIQVTFSASSYGMNGKLQPYFVYFMLEGDDRDCGGPASIKIDSTQADPLYKIVPAKNYSTFSGAITTCAYSLPDARNL